MPEKSQQFMTDEFVQRERSRQDALILEGAESAGKAITETTQTIRQNRLLESKMALERDKMTMDAEVARAQIAADTMRQREAEQRTAALKQKLDLIASTDAVKYQKEMQRLDLAQREAEIKRIQAQEQAYTRRDSPDTLGALKTMASSIAEAMKEAPKDERLRGYFDRVMGALATYGNLPTTIGAAPQSEQPDQGNFMSAIGQTTALRQAVTRDGTYDPALMTQLQAVARRHGADIIPAIERVLTTSKTKYSIQSIIDSLLRVDPNKLVISGPMR